MFYLQKEEEIERLTIKDDLSQLGKAVFIIKKGIEVQKRAVSERNHLRFIIILNLDCFESESIHVRNWS